MSIGYSFPLNVHLSQQQYDETLAKLSAETYNSLLRKLESRPFSEAISKAIGETLKLAIDEVLIEERCVAFIGDGATPTPEPDFIEEDDLTAGLHKIVDKDGETWVEAEPLVARMLAERDQAA